MKIIVKSDPKFFKKEKDGSKPNTIRKLDGRDTITIRNSEDENDFIIRTITDLSIHEGWLIISFKPEPIQEVKEAITKVFPGSEVEVEEQPMKLKIKLKQRERETERERGKRGKRGSYKKKPLPEWLKCPTCKSSKDIIKRGFRNYKGKRIQKYECRECNKMFSENPPLKKGRPSLKGKYFNEVKELYKTLPLTKVVKELRKRHGINFKLNTVHNWLKDAGLTKKRIPSPKPKPKEEQKEGLMAQSFKYFKQGLSDEEIAGLLKVKESMIKTFREFYRAKKKKEDENTVISKSIEKITGKKQTLEEDGVEEVTEDDWEDEDNSE